MNKRGGIFREPARRSAEKHRSQRVRFRRAYASSVLKRTGTGVLKAVAVVAVLGAIGYGGLRAYQFWQNSSTLRISSIQYEGDIPPTLHAIFPLKSGDHLFGVGLGKIETDLKNKFPELSEMTVSRRLGRSVIVEGKYKVAEALYDVDGKMMGVSSDGTLFPISEHNAPKGKLPVIAGKANLPSRMILLKALETWKNGAPAFWTLVKRVETDSIGAVRVTLEDGVVVQWGEMSEGELLVHAANILNVLDHFTPTRTPAFLHVLAKNRVVMDSNWTQKKR